MAEYIDREKLIKEIDEAMDSDGLGYSVGQTMKRYLQNQPVADVATVKKGVWMARIDSGRIESCKYSVCGCETPSWYGIPAICASGYCGYCGAYMENDFTEMY